MPNSMDHCSVCSFGEVETGSKEQLPIEHTVNMDAIYGRKDIADALKKEDTDPETLRRISLAQVCAQKIISGECTLFEVTEERGRPHLVDKVQIH